MESPRRYDPRSIEPELAAFWQQEGINQYDPDGTAPVYSIDTPPPTVSGYLHLGHVYSYSQTDFIARFRRMNGDNVFYPMGFDDNGLPTERLVERQLGVTAAEVGRKAFVEQCLRIGREIERDYETLWQRLGLSIDWRYTYRTIDAPARRTSQRSFIDFYRAGRAYRQKAPTIWCPECHTAIAQAELDDLERESPFATLPFARDDGGDLLIATTRPELLPACVAVFVHPDDARYRDLVDRRVRVPIVGHEVPVLADALADPQKGTGAVMCCTFGDTTDVQWWRTRDLPLREAIGRDGRMTAFAGDYAGLLAPEARERIIADLDAQGLIRDARTVAQSVRVHERCDTPVEYIVTQQWFIRVLDRKEEFLAAGEAVTWRPAHMKARYREWVENLGWDWPISRQRYFGLPFPVWYCSACGEVVLADEAQLPVDPTVDTPAAGCRCGGALVPEEDVMDTWATSSLSPQIVGRWLDEPALYGQVFPMALRTQAHEIIRTWAFYTIVKSQLHFGVTPWKEIAISGWGLAPKGVGKISKSRGGGPIAPLETIERYSADAARYWAASTALGKDSIISEDKIAAGAKLVTKLWNVAAFSRRFLDGYAPPAERPMLSPADRWILSRAERLVAEVTAAFDAYDYSAAKTATEMFFWQGLADNYLEMAKTRLYSPESPAHEGARYALYHVLRTTVKLFAPILPFVTEAVYRTQFATVDGSVSVHRSAWPQADETLFDDAAERVGEVLVEVATAVRRYKSERGISLGAEVGRLQLATGDAALAAALRDAVADLASVTRARSIEVVDHEAPALEALPTVGLVRVVVEQ